MDADLARAQAGCLVVVRCDQDGGNRLTGGGERFAQLESAHPGHAHVRDETRHAAPALRTKKALRVGKRARGKTGGLQQVQCGTTDRRVVINDRYARRLWWHRNSRGISSRQRSVPPGLRPLHPGSTAYDFRIAGQCGIAEHGMRASSARIGTVVRSWAVAVLTESPPLPNDLDREPRWKGWNRTTDGCG